MFVPSQKNYAYGSVFVLALLFQVTAAHAAPTGTVTITGRVPAACDVIVTPEVGASNIDDISAGDTDRIVATVNENCNDEHGYTVSVVGTNSTDYTGLFVDTISGDSHPFTINYDSTPVPFSGIVTDVENPGFNLNKIVQITYAADNTLQASAGYTYTETLTFTITAK